MYSVKIIDVIVRGTSTCQYAYILDEWLGSDIASRYMGLTKQGRNVVEMDECIHSFIFQFCQNRDMNLT